MSDEKHEEIRRLGSALIEKNPKVFQPRLFSLNSARQQQILSTCYIFSDRFRLIYTDFVTEFEQLKIRWVKGIYFIPNL